MFEDARPLALKMEEGAIGSERQLAFQKLEKAREQILP